MDVTLVPINLYSFEHWLRVERHYAARERSYVHQFKFDRAAKMRERRMRCFDLAIQSASNGMIEAEKIHAGAA
jgi:hypothetical protein